jgi:putative drug exporter of the RND superfamily
MFKFIARIVIAHPWRVIVLWIIGSAVVIGFAPKLSTYTTANQQTFLSQSYESVKAQNVGNAEFPVQSGASGSIVIYRSDGGQLTQSDMSKVASLATTLQNDHIPNVASVYLPAKPVSSNGKVELVAVAFKGQPGDEGVNDAVPVVRQKTTSYLKGSGLDSGMTGSGATSVDTNTAYSHAEKIIGVATIILIVALLGIVFRSPIIAVLPIAVIFLIFNMAEGVTASLAKGFGFMVGNSLGPLLIVVMFGVGTDYMVFLLFRYRETLRAGESYSDALHESSRAIGRVIASSAITVIAAFASLLLASLGSLQTLAPGLIVGVLLMLLAALTLVPALFALLGRHLFWPGGVGSTKEDSVAARIARRISGHPALVAGSIGVVLVALSFGSVNYSPTYNTLAELPSSTEALEAYYTMSSAFPAGVLGPTQVYVTGSQTLTSASLQNLVTRLQGAQGVAQVAQPQLNSDKTAALVTVILKDNPSSDAALDNVEGPVRNAAHGSVPGDQVLVGGQTATLVDVRNSIHSSTHLIFPVALAIIFVILGLLLLSVVAPVFLLLGVALAYAATLGALALVFLTLGGLKGIDFSNPIVLYLFVIAIGTDYNILTSERLRERFVEGRTPREAVIDSMTHGAPAVWTAGIILAGTFASLLICGIANLIELGFGVMIGIIITAFFMAPVAVPMVSELLGRIFWWPSRRHDDGSGRHSVLVSGTAAGKDGSKPVVGAPSATR